MGLRKLILLSLVALPLSLGAETASDYINRGAQKYIFGHEEAAKAEVDAGLAKFPDDPELREMLALFKKKPPQDQKDQNNDKKNNKDQDDRDKSQQKDSSNGSDQNQDKDKATPTPSPSEDKQQGGGEESPTPTPGSSPSEGESPNPSPTPGDMPSPTPTPDDGQDGNNGEGPSPNPSGSPSKPLTGEVKGAGEEKPQGTPAGEIAEAEPEKDGEMSPKQAAALLESMKDEEQKVQLDEHRRAAPVYKDW
jgi:hypothetical protein